MKFLKPHLLFKAETPGDLRQYIGKTVWVPEYITDHTGKKTMIRNTPVFINSIVGSLVQPTHFEINNQYLINMLRFYKQINGAKDISDEDIEKFEETQFHVDQGAATKH